MMKNIFELDKNQLNFFTEFKIYLYVSQYILCFSSMWLSKKAWSK